MPAAVGAWAAAALVVALPPAAAAWAAVVVTIALMGVLLLGTRAERGVAVAGQIVLVGAVMAVVCGAAAAQLHARASGGLAAHAAEQAAVSVQGVVRAAPVAMPSAWPGAEPRVRLVLQVDSVEARGVRTHVSAQVRVWGGPGWAGLRTGDEVAARGRLQPLDPSAREAAAMSVPGDPEVVAEPPAVLRATGRIRAGLGALADRLPGDAGALLPGMAVGDTSRLPDDLADAMRVSGLTHLTAVSGAHFVLVGAAALGCATVLGLARPFRAAATALVLTGFTVLVEPSPSVLRAAAMGAVGLAGLIAGRPARALPALGAAVVVLLVADPWLAREFGFVLSVLATAALVTLTGPLAERWSWMGSATAARALAAPFAAQSACAPVVLLLTPSVSTYAVAANLLVAPVVAPVTVVGLGAALLAPVWPPGALALAQVAGAGCWWVGAVARTAARAPGAQVAWAEGAMGAALLGVATLAALRLLLMPRADGPWPRPDTEGPRAPHGAGAPETGPTGVAGRWSVAGWGSAPHTTLDESDLPRRRTRHSVRDSVVRGRARAGGARVRR